MTVLKLSDYETAIYHTVVLSLNEVSDTVCFEITKHRKCLELLSICESTIYDQNEIPISTVTQNNKWIDITKTALNLKEGFHWYTFTFNDTDLNIEIKYHVGYNIQNNNISRPYIYMKRDEDNE